MSSYVYAIAADRIDDSKSEWMAQQWVNYADDLLTDRTDGNWFPSTKEYEEALVAYDQALQITPNYEGALEGKGAMLLFRGGNLSHLKQYEEAIAAYDQALQILLDDNSYKNTALSAKWFAMQELGQYEALIISCNQALAANFNSVDALFYKASAFYQLGQYEEAIAIYDQLLKANPRHFFAPGNKGVALCKLGRYEEAIAIFDRCVELVPEDAEAIFNKGFASCQLGCHKEALAAFDRVLVINPTATRLFITERFY